MGEGRFFVSTSDCSARLSHGSDRDAEPIAFSGAIGYSWSADELFCNGRIRPVKPSSAAPQKTPLLSFEHPSEAQPSKKGNDIEEKERGRRYLWRNKKGSRNRCLARSLSPQRNSFSHWGGKGNGERNDDVIDNSAEEEGLQGIKIVDPASSSKLLKPTRGSRRKWSLTDIFFRRCKSDGAQLERDEMELSFSSYAKLSISSDRDAAQGKAAQYSKKMGDTTINRMGVSASAKELHSAPSPNRRGVPASAQELHYIPSPNRRVSAHELHYTENRALSQELRRKTFLPYRQGVLGCLRFPSPPEGTQGNVLQSLH